MNRGAWWGPKESQRVAHNLACMHELSMARGSASWLSSHGRGLGPRDALKKDSRGLCRGAALFKRLCVCLSKSLSHVQLFATLWT